MFVDLIRPELHQPLDPQFQYCYPAIAAGYGPYYQGKDPEYYQDAVPTLVEVKRSSDTRIRREVVGQMLDYAANGVRYWPPTDLRAAFEATQREAGRDPGKEITQLTGNSAVGVEEFFAEVGDNLRAGRIRMVFPADVIPDELRRITEFLNEQMTPAEVYAVEVKTYRAQGHDGMVIVPTVFGRWPSSRAWWCTRPRPGRC